MKQKRTAKGETSENFFDHLNEWALESIGLITFDKRLGLLRKPDSSRLNQLVKKVMRLCFEYDVMPSIWRVNQSANPGFQNTLSTFEALSRIVKDHVEDGRRKIEKMEKPSEATAFEKWIGIDRQVAFVMALDCIMSGVDPTTCGAVSILYALAKNPDKQAILREELLQILPEKCSNLTAQSLENVPYVRAVVKEALRLHPPFNGNIRALDQSMVIKGYQIPKDVKSFEFIYEMQFEKRNFNESSFLIIFFRQTCFWRRTSLASKRNISNKAKDSSRNAGLRVTKIQSARMQATHIHSPFFHSAMAHDRASADNLQSFL